MTTKQAASRLGVDRKTVQKYILRGLTKTRFGRRLYLRASVTDSGAYDISAENVRAFRQQRKAWGL